MEQLKPILSRKKRSAIVSAIKDISVQKGPGWKLQTVRELASQFNVSRVTLDNALRELEQQGIIYCKHGSGIYVSDEINKKTIGILLGSYSVNSAWIHQILFRTAIEKIKSHNENYSYYLDIPETQNKSSDVKFHYQLEKDIETGRIDGILALTVENKEQIQLLQKRIPTVCFYATGLPGTVDSDHKNFIETGVNILFQKGCKKIGLITPFGYVRKEGYFEDIKGYKKAVKKLNIKYKPQYIWEEDIRIPEETNEEIGYRAMKEIYNRNKDIDGIVINDDTMTKGAMVAAKEYGIEIGKDIKIVTHANKGSSVLSLYEKDLILLEIDPVEIIDNMVLLLEKWIETGIPCEERILIKPKIKIIE